MINLKKIVIPLSVVLLIGFLLIDTDEKVDFDVMSLHNTELDVVVTLNMSIDDVQSRLGSASSFKKIRENGSEKMYAYLDGDDASIYTYFSFKDDNLMEIRTYSPHFETLDGISVTDRTVDSSWTHLFQHRCKQRLFNANGHLIDNTESANTIHFLNHRPIGEKGKAAYLSIKLKS